MAKKKQSRIGLSLILCLALFLAGVAGGAYAAINTDRTPSDRLPSAGGTGDGELSIHFLELGNAYTGDCTYIKAGETDILIDAGSKTGSITTITDYLDDYVTDGVLEYVIVTHAHEDHYAGFATNETTDSLFDIYECEVIIDFAKTNKEPTAKMQANYLRERQEAINRGATHYTAAECIEQNKSVFDLGDGMSLNILDSYYYYNRASTENDYSVCAMLSDGKNHYLFTGDLEEKGEEYLTVYNDLPTVKLYKAGHHGSKTSSTDALLSVIRPEIVCVCCCAGSAEYTKDSNNQFPTQDFIDRVAPYTADIYVTTLCVDWSKKTYTSFNGDIIVCSVGGEVSVTCSASSLKLKESAWFAANRIWPAYGK